jgi:hypothetical protein
MKCMDACMEAGDCGSQWRQDKGTADRHAIYDVAVTARLRSTGSDWHGGPAGRTHGERVARNAEV